ncbi:MAG: hypothetical protein L6306_07860 [Planctomycetales bacterium]|nr:hypothetical protein [Planctomycetales bacterium]
MALQKSSALDAIRLEEHVGLPPGTLRKITTDPHRFVNSQVIQSLADPFDIDIEACFKSAQLSPDVRDTWKREADAEEFVTVAGSGKIRLSDNDRLKLYMILRALRELDKV